MPLQTSWKYLFCYFFLLREIVFTHATCLQPSPNPPFPAPSSFYRMFTGQTVCEFVHNGWRNKITLKNQSLYGMFQNTPAQWRAHANPHGIHWCSFWCPDALSITHPTFCLWPLVNSTLTWLVFAEKCLWTVSWRDTCQFSLRLSICVNERRKGSFWHHL